MKKPEERKKEISETAKDLFQTIGYNKTTVDAIVKKVGIAKGTFYYYFSSKTEVLSYIAQNIVDEMVNEVKKITKIEEMDSLEKMKTILRGQSDSFDAGYEIVDHLHQPENRELHERINAEIILKISPVIAEIIEQGNFEGSFNVEKPVETIQIILAGSQFLLNTDIFNWSETQRDTLNRAMQILIERSLGAEKGSLSFLQEPYTSSSNKTNKTK